MRDLSPLKFDEKMHRYFLGGRAVFSVTKILDLVGITDFSLVNRDILDRACNFGAATHKATFLWDRGTLDQSSLDASLAPYLDAWKNFKAAEIKELLELEAPIWSKRFGFAGTPDRIAIDTRGRLTIVDIKTSTSMSRAVKLQTAGYQIGWEELESPKKIQRRVGVLLRDDGSYLTEDFNDRSDRDDFVACVRVAAFMLKNGIKGVRS